MKKTITYLLLAAAATLLLAGCQKSGLFGSGNGEIRFTATASPATKTVYGANVAGSGNAGWQSIDWVNGDKIRIYSDNAVRRVGFEAGEAAEDLYHWADYSVTGATQGTSQSSLSSATLENLIDDGNGLGNGLMWGNATTANFYALYPRPISTEAKGPSIDGATGKLNASIPDSQAPKDGKPDMSYAFMTAAGSGDKPATDNKNNITLLFEPAFTAFEIELKSDSAEEITLTKFELIAESTAPALTGAFAVSYNTSLQKTVSCTGTGRTLTYTFPENTKVSSSTTQTFTVFALPQATLTGLTLRFTLGNGETRSLPLKSSGIYVNFTGGQKHRILGVIMPKDLGSFKTITLDPVAGEWIEVTIDGADTDNLPEATQFVVVGAKNGRYSTSADYDEYPEGRNNKDYRQYWLFKEDGEVTVSFKIMAPAGGTWRVEKAGADADKFTVTIPSGTGTTETLTGSIAPKAASNEPANTTVVTLTIKRNATNHTASTEAVLYLKTYVTDTNGTTYSIDSETQLLDMRGYHYFVLNNRNTVQ